MKIGIFGGSFDPIHKGHLNMAEKAWMEYGLDEVWLIPAGHSPNKDEARMTAAEERLAMCKIASKTKPYLKVSDIEVASSERSYTYRTLQKLKQLHPADDFFFLMGADSLDYFEQWSHPEIISSLSHILVVNRDEFEEQDLLEKIKEIRQLFPADIRIVHCDKYPVSSHEIRKKLSSGLDVSEWMDEAVLQYLKKKKLYV